MGKMREMKGRRNREQSLRVEADGRWRGERRKNEGWERALPPIYEG